MPGLEQIRWSAWLLVALFIIGCNSTPAVIQAPTQQLAVSNEQLAISNEQLVTSTLHPPTLQPSNPPTLQPSSLPTFQPSTAPPVQPSTPPAAQYSTQPISLTGSLCYPSTETPPLTLFFQNLATQATTELDIPRGLSSYAVELPPGEYIAYAQTVGTRLQGAYTCGADEPCPFTVEPDQSAAIDLCTWYQPPGLQPSLGEQPNDEVWIRLEQAMLARTGPGLETPELSLIESGSLSQATARSADGLWLEVKPAGDDQTGWLHAPLVRIYGNPESLPVKGDNSPVSKPASFTPAVWRSEANPNMVLFRGEIRDEQDRPVNGYSILLDNGTWSVLSHPTGASRHYPNVPDGQWDVIIDNETDAAGWWSLTVVRYDCPDFEQGFNAQCKQFPPVSETKVVKVVHPDENIIEANWTCHESCDDGLYAKPYRPAIEPIPDHLLLYAEDRALKMAPPNPAFDRPELKRFFDPLPESFTGLHDFLAEHRPRFFAERNTLVLEAPAGESWQIDLEEAALRPADAPDAAPALDPALKELIETKLAPTTAWALSHDDQQIAYARQFGSSLQQDIYLYNRATDHQTLIGPINGYLVTEIRWTEKDDL
nr:PT domain-containing protein [Anaerolineae bacterium]